MCRLHVLAPLALGLALLTACSDDGRPPGTAGIESGLVGGPCMNNTECDALLCQSGALFPGGTCTISCGNSGNCPSGSSCAETEVGWLCAVDCTEDVQCRTNYPCTTLVEAGTDGNRTVSVCVNVAPES